MSLGYLIVTYNGQDTINELLDSIPAKEDILVVDNASQDNTVALVQKKNVRVIQNQGNKGYAAGINRGLKLLQEHYDHVFVLNQDTVLKAPSPNLSHEGRGNNMDYGIIQPLILLPDGTVNVDELVMNVFGYVYPRNFGKTPSPPPPLPHQGGGIKQMVFFSGAAFIINIQKWKKLGPFNESLFLYYEDVDYALRCLLHNEKIFFDPALIVEHKYKNSWHNQAKKSLLQKNRKIIVQRYFSHIWQRLIFVTDKSPSSAEEMGEVHFLLSAEQKKILTNKLLSRLVLGFHTRQIPWWQRWAVNLFLVPYAWIVRKIVLHFSSLPGREQEG